MSIESSPFCEETTCHSTAAAHTQAMTNAIQTMHSHLQERLALEDLAAATYLSPFHFNRVFRRLTGIPPWAIIQVQ